MAVSSSQRPISNGGGLKEEKQSREAKKKPEEELITMLEDIDQVKNKKSGFCH
jgi:hypothetical protein